MFVKIGQRADHGFDEPLGLLSDCHRRIEHFLGVLHTVARERQGGALDGREREAVEQALRYFSTAAPRHTADEEASLFPRLRASGDPTTLEPLRAIAALEADHRFADEQHAIVHALFSAWLDGSSIPPGDRERLAESLDALKQLYERHIAVEDRELFPVAARVLTPADLEAIGREMANRRHVPFRPEI